MEAESPFPDEFDPSSSLLFLGSGFSVEALNIAGTCPPVGRGLEKLFSKELGLADDSGYELKDIVNHAAKNGVDIYKLLYNNLQ